jgi:hypothetical protein
VWQVTIFYAIKQQAQKACCSVRSLPLVSNAVPAANLTPVQLLLSEGTTLFVLLFSIERRQEFPPVPPATANLVVGSESGIPDPEALTSDGSVRNDELRTVFQLTTNNTL